MNANKQIETDIQNIVKLLEKESAPFLGKSVLLAGANGFLGRYLSQFFAELNLRNPQRKIKLLLLDNGITAATNEAGEETLNDPEIEFLNHDICQPLPEEFKNRFSQGFDYLIHAASIASPYYYQAYPMETLLTGVSGTNQLLQLARKSRARMLFFSSSEIYGDPARDAIPTKESYKGHVSCTGPRACYDESKRIGETLCYIYHQHYGVHTNMVRPFNVYGPGMREQDYRLLPNIGACMKNGQAISIYGDGRQTRTFCYITDAIVGFIKVLLHGVPGEPYNIGNPNPEISAHDLASLALKVTGKNNRIKLVEYPDSYPEDEPNRRCPDIRKARQQLGYQPLVSLEQGMENFFNWTDANYLG